MQLVADPDMAQWLAGFERGAEAFDWDDGNRGKNAKHEVDDEEIEAIFGVPFLLAGRIVEPAHPESRWIILGETDKGRRLALIFTRRDDRLRPISCRPMRKKEKAIYEEAIES